MKLILFLTGRLIVIAFALLVALVAGSLFIGFGLAAGMFPELMSADGSTVFADPEIERSVLAAISFLFGIMASFHLAGLMVLPVTIAIAVMEMMRWRSLAVQLVIGGLCALFVMFSVLDLPTGQLPSNGTVIVSLAAGFVATFFYWLIAGRNAGEWLSALYQEDADREG